MYILKSVNFLNFDKHRFKLLSLSIFKVNLFNKKNK